MTLLIALAALTALIALYVVWLRPWLREKPWAAGFFRFFEPVELLLWRKSESILWARFLQVVGLVVPFLQFVGAVDVTPYLAIVPTQYQPYLMLLIFVAGQIGEKLRKDTTKPLEAVALPEVKTPAEERAVEKIEAANANLANVIEAQKA